MTSGVVPFDVLKLCCASKRVIIPVQISQPRMDAGISRPDITNVALEMLNIHWIKSDNRRVPRKETRFVSNAVLTRLIRSGRYSQSQINFADVLAEPERSIFLSFQMLFHSIESFEEQFDILLVGCASCSKTGLVYAIVDRVIDPIIRLINVFLKIFRANYNVSVFLLNKVIELFPSY